MSQTSATQRTREQTTDNTAIREFELNFPEADLIELRRRINTTKWPEQETVADHSQGVPLATMRKLAQYWGTDYDWRKCDTVFQANRLRPAGTLRTSRVPGSC